MGGSVGFTVDEFQSTTIDIRRFIAHIFDAPAMGITWGIFMLAGTGLGWYFGESIYQHKESGIELGLMCGMTAAPFVLFWIFSEFRAY